MKKFALYILALVLVAVSCKKDDYVFDQSPDERLNEALARYQSVLTGSATGWKATIQPALGGVFHYFLQFNNENRVLMYADFDVTTAGTKGESSYRLKALQQPTLIFDTYSYLHLLSDPDARVNGGELGSGLQSDFEFTIESASEDSVVLVGRVNKTKFKLERATQAEMDAWQNGDWLDILLFLNVQHIENYFKRLTIGGNTYEVTIDQVSRIIRFQWLSGGNLQTFTTYYNFNSEGVILGNPLVNGDQTITGFSNLEWNENTRVLSLSSGSTPGTISGAAAPLRVDLNAPQRWWQEAIDRDSYWYSPDGFHVNGVDDGYDLNSLDRYYYTVYWPGYEPGGYDLFAPVFINNTGDGLTLQYGAAPDIPTFTAGKAIFEFLGTLGPHPSSGPAFRSIQTLFHPEGFYFVETSKGYDMVSVADSRIWISWQGAW